MSYTIEQLETAAQSAYERGFAAGSGDEGAYQREIARLRKQLEKIQQASLTWAMVCDCNCKACQGLHKMIRDALPQSGELDSVSGNE